MTIHDLFATANKDNKDSPFETEKENELIEKTIEFFPEFNDEKRPGDIEDKAVSALYDLICYERERAFTIGYKTAISIILAGVTVE